MNLKGFRQTRIYVEGQGIIETGLAISDGKISKIENAIAEEEYLCLPPNLMVVPGFIDKHFHGAVGVDVMTGNVDQIQRMLTALAKEGITGCLATTMTVPLSQLQKAIGILSDIIEHPQNGVRILGIHLEGPFISAKEAGAQLKTAILPCDVDIFEKLNERHHILQVTLACEEQADGLIRHLHRQGIVVSLGHSDCTYEQGRIAVKLGASSVTHTFNAMRPFHHREVGLAGLALVEPALNCELICDRIHVSDPAIRLLYRMKTAKGICLITDSMEAKQLTDGEYRLGGQNVSVSGSKACLADGTLAGSVLKMNEAIRNFKEVTHCPLTEAIDCATIQPAEVLKLDAVKGSIAVGKDADFTVIDENLNVYMTIVGGKIVYDGRLKIK